MPASYVVTGPDGKKRRITPPEGASEAEIQAALDVLTQAKERREQADVAAFAPPPPPVAVLSKGEKIDRAVTGIPAALAMAATIPVSGPGAVAVGAGVRTGFGALVRAALPALTRTAVAGQAGTAGSVIQSALQVGLDTPGKPKSLGEAASRAAMTGGVEGLGQGGAELLGAVPGMVMGVGRSALRNAPKTVGGQRAYKEQWDALAAANEAAREAKNEAATSLMEEFGRAVQPHEVGEIGREGVETFRRTFKNWERNEFAAFEVGLANSRIDYRDIATDLVSLEKKRPKAKGGLAGFTDTDKEWADLVARMEAGQKPVVVPLDKGQEVVRGPLGETLKEGRPGKMRLDPAPNAVESGAAVVRARSAISSRLHDIEESGGGLAAGYTKEYVEGLRDLKRRLDAKILGAATEAGPDMAAGWKKLLEVSGQKREILGQTWVKMAESNRGDLAKNLLNARRPDWVDQFNLMVREGAIPPDAAQDVRRAGLESLLLRTKKSTGEKSLDIENFASRFDQTGAAGKRLFSDQKSAQVVANLKEMSQELKALPKTAKEAGIPYVGVPENRLMELVASAVGYRITNLVFVPREAYAMMNSYLVRLASNPQAHKKMMAAIRTGKAAEKWSPTAANAMLDAMRTARVVDGISSLFAPALAPAHEVQR